MLMMSFFSNVFASSLNSYSVPTLASSSIDSINYFCTGYLGGYSSDNIYGFGYDFGSTSNCRFRLVSKTQNAVYYKYTGTSNGVDTFNTTYTLSDYDSTTGLYYLDIKSGNTFTTYPINKLVTSYYSNASDGMSESASYISSLSSVGDGYLTNGLPVGNVIYFDLGSSGVEYDITLKSYFTSKSSWFGSTWVNDNRRYGFTNALPSTATNFDESSGSSIPWSPSGSTDLLGRSNEGSVVISGTSTGRYLWILNPLYNLGYYDEPDKGTSLNGNIFYIGGISIDTPYYIYSLKQSATTLGLSSDVASSVGGVGSVTSSGAINTVVNDGSGEQYVPSVGGDNSAPQEVSATEGIKQTLDQFVQMFLNIFTAPISHIQQLISAGSEFISHISGLWSWLPSEVSGFVASAFVVMVAISIFKLFL